MSNMDPIYDSPFNPFGIEKNTEDSDLSRCSLKDLKSKEEDLLVMLKARQAEEPKKRRNNKLEYDFWVRSVEDIIHSLEVVRDEMIRRKQEGNEMLISDIVTFSDGRTSCVIISDECPEVHAGDIIIDACGNRFLITGVGNVKNCFDERYNVSVMIDGKAVKGKVRIKPGGQPQ